MKAERERKGGEVVGWGGGMVRVMFRGKERERDGEGVGGREGVRVRKGRWREGEGGGW